MKRKKKRKNNIVVILISVLVIILAIFIILKINDINIKKAKEKARIAEIKTGWYVEINTEYINIRPVASRYGKELGKVYKGEVYKVEDFDYSQSSYNWYKITTVDNITGWIANPKNSDLYLTDNNNPQDYATPTIKYTTDEYHVSSIDKIKYDHLILWDDKDDYKVTHIVYHEKGINAWDEYVDQYWIQYTITDGTGKSSSKLQRITFDILPEENQVQNFDNYKR